jgi:hypothetical protein
VLGSRRGAALRTGLSRCQHFVTASKPFFVIFVAGRERKNSLPLKAP